MAITAQGFEWKATDGGAYTQVTVTGDALTYNLTGLTANTSYTFRAFVTTAEGTIYGDEVTFTTLPAAPATFTCGTSTVTDYDGNTYNTLLIGEQCWMKENLRTTHYADGTSIPYDQSLSNTAPSYYDYSTSSIQLEQRGYLYNWPAAMHGANPSGVQGVCPTGWHVPSDAEWTTMETVVNGSVVSGTSTGRRGSHAGKLAGGGGWASSSTSGAPGDYGNSQRNASGFGAVPAGACNINGFNSAGGGALFWSSTQYNLDDAYYRYLHYDFAGVSRDKNTKHDGFSVRCLRD